MSTEQSVGMGERSVGAMLPYRERKNFIDLRSLTPNKCCNRIGGLSVEYTYKYASAPVENVVNYWLKDAANKFSRS